MQRPKLFSLNQFPVFVFVLSVYSVFLNSCSIDQNKSTDKTDCTNSLCGESLTPGVDETESTNPGVSNEACGGKCTSYETCIGGQCICKPFCDGTSCFDGCGGICECLGSDLCNSEGTCVLKGQCVDTCSSTQRECSSVCGEICGTCGADESCLDYQCTRAESCADCPLKLVLVDSKTSGSKLTSVTIGLDYFPRENDPKPTLADFRLFTDSSAELVDIRTGSGLEDAEKVLFVDPNTDKPYRKRNDGSYQMLVQSQGSVKEFAAGRLLTMTFQTDVLGPVTFSLAKRTQTFAPLSADAPLQATDYQNSLVVSK